MISSNPSRQVLAPFPIGQLPVEVQGLCEDFWRAPIQPHPSVTDPLVTVIVPCFNPKPTQFSQLLLSIQQQSDQNFDLLIVNDGSNPEAWEPIQWQLQQHPWIQVLYQPSNGGISSALNAAVAHQSSAYVAILDQDDLLHPGAVCSIRSYLLGHPDCGLLYSDHITFDESSSSCQYIPKFPWNPEALLEFNFLIHLTVIRADLYRACGEMNSCFDGIQDWEFYLRLARFLSPVTVGYLPIPLYAWRLSETSVASSAHPKAHLLEHVQKFLPQAHSHFGAGSALAQSDANSIHYKFSIERACPKVPVRQTCNLLLLAGDADTELINASLLSLVASGLQIADVFIARDSCDLPLGIIIPFLGQMRPQINIISCSMQDLQDHLPSESPLLVLQAGACFEDNSNYGDLPGWLERSKSWDLLTLPGFNRSSGRCVSAGYSRFIATEEVYLPHGQTLTRESYTSDFASFGHTRWVDLPSPSLQLLSTSCLQATLELFRSNGDLSDCSVTQAWWRQLCSGDFRCCCPDNLFLQLSPPLVASESQRLLLRDSAQVLLVRTEVWLGRNDFLWNRAYGALLSRILEQGTGRMHALHAYDQFARSLHPAILRSSELRCVRPSLLPKAVHRPMVILIPTELNARSHGHACLLTLALKLMQSGREVYLLPYKPYTFFRHYQRKLPSRFRNLPFIANPAEAPGALLVVPESAPPNLVRNLRPFYDQLLWWLLAPAGLLTGFKPDIRCGDRLAAFSEFVLPSQPRYLFIQPRLEPELMKFAGMHAPQPPRHRLVALYTGKGRLKVLPRSLHRHLLTYQVIVITRSFPQSKRGLIRLLTQCNGLLTCDPLTNLNLEAANLGVPCFLTSNPFNLNCFRKFPCDLTTHVTDSASIFIAWLQRKGPVTKLSTEPLVRADLDGGEFLELLTETPAPIAESASIVGVELLSQIKDYRNDLTKSRSIQVVRDGQSLSSAFTGYYASSLKAPYAIHWWFCFFLGLVDAFGDLILLLGLARLLVPLQELMGKLFRFFGSRLSLFKRLLGG